MAGDVIAAANAEATAPRRVARGGFEITRSSAGFMHTTVPRQQATTPRRGVDFMMMACESHTAPQASCPVGGRELRDQVFFDEIVTGGCTFMGRETFGLRRRWRVELEREVAGT